MSAEPVAMRRPAPAASQAAPVGSSWRPPPQHGRVARLAKYALPLAAVGLAVLIFAWARINPVIERIQLSDTELAPQEIETITMLNARFNGIDSKNRAFNVTAARAVQSVDDVNRIQLERPKADIVLPNGSHIAIESETGGLQRNTQILDLYGAVTVAQNQAYEFRTSQAQIDLDKRTAGGSAPVEGHGPDGEIRADGFQIVDDGARVMFTGRSRAILRSQQEPTQP